MSARAGNIRHKKAVDPELFFLPGTTRSFRAAVRRTRAGRVQLEHRLGAYREESQPRRRARRIETISAAISTVRRIVGERGRDL